MAAQDPRVLRLSEELRALGAEKSDAGAEKAALEKARDASRKVADKAEGALAKQTAGQSASSRLSFSPFFFLLRRLPPRHRTKT